MRYKIVEFENQLKKVISENIKKVMAYKGFSQAKLAEISGVPQSTISDIITEKTLATPGRIQQIADALQVPKSTIDPSFDPNNNGYDIAVHVESLEAIENLYFEGKKLSLKDRRVIRKLIAALLEECHDN